jgi:hypothetical protein
MDAHDRLLDFGEPVLARLDQALPFLGRFDRSLPLVNALDRPDDLDAARQSCRNQFHRDPLRLVAASDRGDDLHVRCHGGSPFLVNVLL